MYSMAHWQPSVLGPAWEHKSSACDDCSSRVISVPRSAAITDGRVRSEEAQRNVEVGCLSTLNSKWRAASTLRVASAELRWTPDKIPSPLAGDVWRMS